MNTNGRWFRAVISGLIICIVAQVRLFGGDYANPLAAELARGPLPIERLVLTGVMTVGKYHVASIHEAKTGAVDWFVEGDYVFGYRLKEIADNHVILVRPGRGAARVPQVTVGGLGAIAPSGGFSGEEFRVELSGSNAGPEPYSRAWINSRANPMLTFIHELPALHQDWPTLTDAEKIQIIDFYKKHGWKLVRVADLGGATEFVWRNIYEVERNAVIKANREKFEQALTPEQLALYTEMRSFRIIFYDEPGRHSDKQKELIAHQKGIAERYRALLTPELEAQQAEIMDFTKANWN
jgi:hypothetical protein